MKRFIISLLASLLVLLLASCGSGSQPTPAPETSSPTPVVTPSPAKISLLEVKAIFDTDKTAVFVDVRAKTDYDKEHITGAINIPSTEFETRYTEILSAPRIIVYAGCFG